jgi:truncated hemoglobin YjbI
MSQQTPFQLLGGEEGIRTLADAFYEAMDELTEAKDIRGMHAENMDEIKEMLKDPMYRIADAVRNQDHSNRGCRDDGVIAVG